MITFSLVLISVGGGGLGIIFDEWFHNAMPIVIPIFCIAHALGIYQYIKQPHKTAGRTFFLVAMTLLFIAGLLFHFTPLHEQLME